MNDISVKEMTIACQNGPSIPTELLTLIIESFILIYSFTRTSNSPFAESVRFTPQWYLLPLLRVSRLWHAITVKYLYQIIAVGRHAPFELPANGLRRDRHVCYSKGRIPANHGIRMGHDVAGDLYRTLETNPLLAAWITTLQLGVEVIYRRESKAIVADGPRVARCRIFDIPYVESSWTRTHSRILKICPNVEHVDIRGFHHLELDALTNELGKKSLVYFSISACNLSNSKWDKNEPVGRFSLLTGLMQKWPKIRGIRVEKFLDADMTKHPVNFVASQVSGCCPDLREIIITGAVLRPDMYRALRTMCSNSITKLAVSLHGRQAGNRGDESVDALCECLRLWSPTLAYFKVDIMHQIDRDSYQPLNDAMRTLGELQELQSEDLKLDLSAISGLPRLQCLAYLPPYRWRRKETRTLSDYLENTEMFPSLNFIVDDRLTVDNGFIEICRSRGIQLASSAQQRTQETAFSFNDSSQLHGETSLTKYLCERQAYSRRWVSRHLP